VQEAEGSPFLKAAVREQLLKTQETGKSVMGAMVSAAAAAAAALYLLVVPSGR
jgi:hypothetical protein